MACRREFHVNTGSNPGGGINGEGGGGRSHRLALTISRSYTAAVGEDRLHGTAYESNTIRTGPRRAVTTQQEVQVGLGTDDGRNGGSGGDGPHEVPVCSTCEARHQDCHRAGRADHCPHAGRTTRTASVTYRLLRRQRRFWKKVPRLSAGNEAESCHPAETLGRFKRGIGVGMSMHHPGHMGYHDGEVGFEKATGGVAGAPENVWCRSRIERAGRLGNARRASRQRYQPRRRSRCFPEMLGFTNRDHVHVVWGDSDIAPSSGQWVAGKTITVQGAAVCSAADKKLRKDLLKRASDLLQVDVAKLKIRDGVISTTDSPAKASRLPLAKRANKGSIRQTGRSVAVVPGRALTRGVGACFR